MLIYFCPSCGKKYEKREIPPDELCGCCGVALKIKRQDLKKKEDTPGDIYLGRRRSPEISAGISGGQKIDDSSAEETKKLNSPENNCYTTDETDITKSENSNNKVEGKIISASRDEGYKRYFWEKLIDKFYYRQRVNDSQNSIYIRCSNSNGTIVNRRIIIYGQMKGGIDLMRTGTNIVGYGKYNSKNEFVAYRLILDSNIEVSMRTDQADIMYLASPLLLSIMLIFTANVSNICEAIQKKIQIQWIFVPVILIAAFWIQTMRRRNRYLLRNRIRIVFWAVVAGVILYFLKIF